MDVLSSEEGRVLGCLIEKEATTPDAYPLTMNALVLACNQTSNRTPTVSYDETLVSDTVLRLRERKLARVVHGSHGSRVSRYRHALPEVWAITGAELAVLAVLMLRGPQTVNELTTRTERYRAGLDDLGGVTGVLDRLAGREAPLAVRLGRQPGQREERWRQLLAEEAPAPGPVAPWSPGPTTPAAPFPRTGEPQPAGPGAPGEPTAPHLGWEPEVVPVSTSGPDLDELIDEVRRLRREFEQLRQRFDRLTGAG